MKYYNVLICKAMLLRQQLTWNSHVVRINDNRLPKAVLYGELWQATRNVGRPHLHYMDRTKQHLHAADINKRHWEEMAYGGSGIRPSKKEPQKLKP